MEQVSTTVAARLLDEQLAACNTRDLERFLATYSEQVEVFRPPAQAPVIEGAMALAEFYATKRFCHPGLRAEILTRIAVGDIVVDLERVHGLPGGLVELVAT